MSEIYELPLSYRISKKYVVKAFRQFYGKYIVTGEENIPVTGTVIFAPNHVNALMDALAVLSLTPDNFSTVFLARADIFNKKMFVKPLKFLKIMPAFRIRDGYENLGKNANVFNKCVELLDKGNALCLMPEGNQEVEKNIRPLVKGIFRIAFQTQQRIGIEKPVKIIPVGIDIEHLVKFGKHIIVNVGKPIDVSEYMLLYAENQTQAMNVLKEKLYAELCDMTLNLDSKEYYRDFEILSEVGVHRLIDSSENDSETLNRFKARQKVANKLVDIQNNDPERMMALAKLASEYRTLLEKFKIRTSNIENRSDKPNVSFLNSFLLLVTFPIFIVGFLLNALPFLTPVLIRKKLKIKFEGFFSSVHFVSAILVTFPLFYFIQTLVFACVTGSVWWVILLFIPLQFLLGRCAFIWYKLLKSVLAQFRIAGMKKNNTFDTVREVYENINSMIFKD
jgi:1-acyl-sn-glycerol-3-phosphate acyltransferase